MVAWYGKVESVVDKIAEFRGLLLIHVRLWGASKCDNARALGERATNESRKGENAVATTSVKAVSKEGNVSVENSVTEA